MDSKSVWRSSILWVPAPLLSKKRKMKKSIIAMTVFALFLTACGKQASPDRLEEARTTAKSNSEFNAQLYRAANPRFTGEYSIIARSDDAQTPDCPQGDGWAEVNIMKVEGKSVDKTPLVCSTYSTSVGCYRTEDFNKNPNLAKQNSGCGSSVPFPLPVLKK
jgi:hypothetical protein